MCQRFFLFFFYFFQCYKFIEKKLNFNITNKKHILTIESNINFLFIFLKKYSPILLKITIVGKIIMIFKNIYYKKNLIVTKINKYIN